MLPEGGEFIASHEHLRHVLERLAFFDPDDENGDGHSYKKAADGGWPLLSIIADASLKECNLDRLDPRSKQGLAFKLKPEYQLSRGSDNKEPCMLWPPGFDTLDGFRFRNVHLNSRSLVFDFTKCYLDLHYLTHTSIQIYSKTIWDDRVFDVPIGDGPGERRFRILIAFEFEHHVLAFLSLDMLGQPKWKRTMPTPSPEIFPGWDTDAELLAVPDDWFKILGELVDWALGVNGVSGMTDKMKNNVAIVAIRTVKRLMICFPGVGLFTVCELWFMAGLPPGLTVWELVSEPSRFARLIEAYYAFIYRCKKDYWERVICPAMHNQFASIATYNTILSPTEDQRIKYAETYLHVYQKDTVMLFERHDKLLWAYDAWIRETWHKPRGTADRTTAPPEPFEPSYIAAAFRKPVHLAHLIFGDDSPLLDEMPRCAKDDPVTKAYRKKRRINSFFQPKKAKEPAFTSVGSYDKLFLPFQMRKVEWVVVHFPGKRGVTGNPVWSASLAEWENGRIADNELRASKLYKHVIRDTNKVTIGPLEYCGYAPPLVNGPAKEIGLFRGDTHLITGSRQYRTIQRFVGRARRMLKLACDQPGTRKRALNKKEFRQVDTKARELMEKEGYGEYVDLIKSWRNRDKVGEFKRLEEQPAKPAPKRKRMSADRRLASSSGELAGTSSSAAPENIDGPLRRSKRPR